ncbi:MAG TPA: disulfide bond formation protein B [Aestuariivirgaceae bacterium]|jgi:disulfide bond formation protein DsbB
MTLTSRDSALAIAAIGTATIAMAWGFQLFAGLSPCPLCLQQRWPYYAAIPLALLLFLHERRSFTWLRSGLLLIALIMLGGSALALYHAGVEWRWWQGPQSCAAAAGGLTGGLPDLSNARVIRCDEAPWRFLGLSFAGWNFLVSVFLAGLALYGARRAGPQGSSSVSQ